MFPEGERGCGSERLNDEPEGVSAMETYVARPGRPGPGVLVLHAWWGLNGDVKAFCDRLAREGFLAVAPDMMGGQGADTVAEAERLLEGIPWESKTAAARTALDWLRAETDGPVGLVGFSMGAFVGLQLAGAGAGDALVTFYGAGPAEGIRIPVLGHYCADDPYEPLADVQELFAALPQGELKVYPNAGHWFMEPSRTAYHAESADRAWKATLAFLQRTLSPKG